MEDQYQQSIAGLESEDPEISINSAIWLIENPESIEEQDYYLHACELLQVAAGENLDCLHYIDENIQKQLPFKAQLLAVLAKEGSDEIKPHAAEKIQKLIEDAVKLKTTDTDIVAQVYSAVEETADSELIEKARTLLQ